MKTFEKDSGITVIQGGPDEGLTLLKDEKIVKKRFKV